MGKTARDQGHENDCNCLAVRQAARHITQIYDRHLARCGLSATQYSLLSKLARLGPMSISELASAMVMDRTTLTRGLRPLERERLIAVGGGADGRTKKIEITAAGKAKHKAALLLWNGAQDEFESYLGRSAAQDLRSMMRRIVGSGPND